MRVFVTGASGFIGSAVVPELLRAGHAVSGLARSDASAAAIEAMGAHAHRGSLDDLDALRAGARSTDGVIHLGFIHDFAKYAAAAETDRRAIEALGEELAESGRPLVIASGFFGSVPGSTATENDRWTIDVSVMPRVAGYNAAMAFAERGVRASAVRLAPTVHGDGDHGFVPRIIALARERGVSGYVGDGANRWTAVHRLDAATLFRLALESAPAGSVLHGSAEEGVPMRAIAELIGRHLGVPVRSIPAESASEHFGWLGQFVSADMAASHAITSELLGWNPTHPGLIEDLEHGQYFASAPALA
jgi:nucleoside-diphosphate-sugar epimerase